jgi:cupin fold WbuC family metalloprotein
MAFRFPVRKENDEVYYSELPFVLIGPPDLEDLKKIAAANPRKRSRLCVHPSPTASLHEMFIVHGREAYVRPHRHLNRQEGFMVLEGHADLLTFSDSGDLLKAVRMDLNCFYTRLNEPTYHMLRIRSEWLVFYEATSGPFNSAETDFAKWSPHESNSAAVEHFLKMIDSHCATLGADS